MFVKNYFMLLSLFHEMKSLNVRIKIKQGTIIGTSELTVFKEKYYYAFYGVPYAQAPIGKLRFKDPEPVKKWTTTLDATTEYHGACAQAHIVHKHGLYGFENCLYLNIYTSNLSYQDTNILKAVIVWIHGYAFTSSFSHIHGADFLIDNDIVVVTLTHRLGAFGFLKINDTDSNANMGLKDIVMGLKWIKRNIYYFGGDKKRITVMGSGSASTFLSLLLVTKHRKLFSKMILQSGSIFSPSIFQGNYKTEKNILEKVIANTGAKDLYKSSAKDVIQASQRIYKRKDIINYQRPVVPFSPIIETQLNKYLLTMDVYEIEKSLRNLDLSKIPILTGFTSQESISEVIPFLHNTHYLKLFESFLYFMVPFQDGCKYEYTSGTYRHISNEIKSWYFKNGISEHAIDDFLKYVSDLHKYPIYKFIKLLISKGGKIYVYKFNYTGKFNAAKATSIGDANIRVKGAAQGDEICYILKCHPLWESYVKLRDKKYHKDRIFIEEIAQMWANFAKTGVPTSINRFGNNTWRPMTIKEDNVFYFGTQNKLTNSKAEQKMFKFWNKIYDEYYKPSICRKYKDEL